MNETFLEAGRRGKHTWWRYLLGVVFIVFVGFVLGGRASLLPGNALGSSPEKSAADPSSAGPIAGYLVVSASFPVFLLGTVLAVTFLHRRSPLMPVTGRRRVDGRRIGAGLGVWLTLAVLASFVGYLLKPSAFSLGSNLGAILAFALPALVLTPIQATAEELSFRGYLVQGASLISSNFLFLAVASGAPFMLPHLANPGLDSGFLLVDLYHFGFGAIVLGFEGSALNTPSLFLTDRFVPAYSLIQLVVTAAIFYVAVLCSSRGAPRRLRRRFASRAVGLICLEGLSKTEGGRCGT